MFFGGITGKKLNVPVLLFLFYGFDLHSVLFKLEFHFVLIRNCHITY